MSQKKVGLGHFYFYDIFGKSGPILMNRVQLRANVHDRGMLFLSFSTQINLSHVFKMSAFST